MVPVIGGKVEERQQCFAILDQAFDGLVVFRRVFLGECRYRGFRCRPIRRQPDFAQVFVCIGLNGLWKLVENVQRLVQPAALVTRRREGLVESFPEAERAVADGDLWRDQQAPRLQIDEQIPSNSARSPACPSGNRSTPSCPRASRQSVPACIRLVAPSAPADRRRPPTRKRSGVPTNRAFATADTRLPNRPSAGRSLP